MGDRRRDASESRFAAYVEGLVRVIGHADRARPLRDYCMGLMMPCERKSVEPMAAVTAPARVAAQHQSLLHFVGEGRWSDEKVLAKIREMVLPELSPIRIATRPKGMLTANSQVHGPIARMPEATVGPSVKAVATTSALYPKPRPSKRPG